MRELGDGERECERGRVCCMQVVINTAIAATYPFRANISGAGFSKQLLAMRMYDPGPSLNVSADGAEKQPSNLSLSPIVSFACVCVCVPSLSWQAPRSMFRASITRKAYKQMRGF